MTTDTGAYDDKTLMAFADGELSADETARLRRAVRADPALAARVDLFAQTRAQARGALKGSSDERVPDALLRSVERLIADASAAETPQSPPAGVRPPRAANDAGKPRRWAMPLAAGIAAVLAGAVGYMAGSSPQAPSSGLTVAGLADATLPRHLATAPSGNEVVLGSDGQVFRAIGTFEDGRGMLCREFELVGAQSGRTTAVACREDATWTVGFALAEPATAEGYAPASSLETLDAYLESIGAEPPLSPEQELAALAREAGE